LEAEPLAEAIREKGFDVRLASCGPSPIGALSIPMLGAFHGTPVPARLAPLRRAVDAADTVHLLGFRDPVGTFAAWRAHRRGIPYILEPVGMYRARIRSVHAKTLFDRTLGIRVARGAAAVIATSAIERDELIDDGISPDRIHVRPNGVDVDALLPLPERGRWRAGHGIPASAPIVLSLGRITTKKGLPHLVQAVAGLPGAWLAIVGPDEHDGSLRDVMATARRLGMIDRLCVLPQGAWGIERAQLFADADVFCLASQTENFGNAPAEAAAVGLPVVVSDRCGVADQLPPEAHHVVPYGDIDRLRNAIGQALTPAAREQAASAAPSVRHALSWSRIADDQAAIYRDNGSTSP
jgi:glycosyltransferase involved in cell wall biosynthesis